MTASSGYTLHHLLETHLARYPRMQVQDLYKLLLQSAMGCEHIVGNTSEARAWLEQEVANPLNGPDELLFDPISPDGQIVRLHLRPYVQSGMDLELLLQAFIRTAAERHGSTEKLKEFGRLAATMAEAGLLPFKPQDILKFWSQQEAGGFQAVHHSEIYQRSYCPAYRVIARKYLEAG